MDDAAEMAAGAEMMVHAAVAYCDVGAARALDARDAGQVHACLADQVSAHLEVALRARHTRIRSEPAERGCRRSGDGRQVERVHTAMVGDAEAGAEHQRFGLQVELLGESPKMRAKMPKFSPTAFASTHCVPDTHGTR